MATRLPGYETTFITRVDITDEALATLKEKLTTLITTFGGEVAYQEDWGKRRFAYPIQKEVRGQYTYIVYSGKPGVVAELERNLRLNESVLRFLTVNLANEFDSVEFMKTLGTGTPMKREERSPDAATIIQQPSAAAAAASSAHQA